jgi:hypothetical protein
MQTLGEILGKPSMRFIPLPDNDRYRIEIGVPYPYRGGPYTPESSKRIHIGVRDFYKLPPVDWYVYLLGQCFSPHLYSWHRYAAKELIEENYTFSESRILDSPLYPHWVGGPYWEAIERGRKKLEEPSIASIIGGMVRDIFSKWTRKQGEIDDKPNGNCV